MQPDGPHIFETYSALLDQVGNSLFERHIWTVFDLRSTGGWCQMVEIYYQVQSYNGTLTDGMLLVSRNKQTEKLIIWQNTASDSGAHECSKAWKA